jgi:hypothetical protein
MAAEGRQFASLKMMPVRPINDDVKSDLYWTLLITLVHLPLGLVLYNAGSFGVVHPVLAVGFGLYLAFRKRSKLSSIALVLGYIIGVEVLWRMAQVPIFWEIGKYGPVVIILVAMIRRARWEMPKLPPLYFLLLVPGCILTVVNVSLPQAQGLLSFNMSGPLLLLFSSWFFFKAQIQPKEFRRLLLAMMIPLLCIAFTTFFYTVSAEDIRFTGESNFETSGGFGPNQVSALLGLGVFIAFAGAVLVRKGIGFTLFFGLSALFLAAICMLTFSRGGIYNGVAGIVVLLVFGLKDTEAVFRRLVLVVTAVAVFALVIFPVLDDFTDGALLSRFEDTQTSGRTEILLADIEVFNEHTLLGVGVGAARSYRREFLGRGAVSHTEFSRLLSEHGVLGLGALFALGGMVVLNLRRPNSPQGKAFIAGALAWSFFFMLNSGMRLGAPSFMWGLGFLSLASIREMRPILMRRRKLSKQRVSRRPVQIVPSNS